MTQRERRVRVLLMTQVRAQLAKILITKLAALRSSFSYENQMLSFRLHKKMTSREDGRWLTQLKVMDRHRYNEGGR